MEANRNLVFSFLGGMSAFRLFAMTLSFVVLLSIIISNSFVEASAQMSSSVVEFTLQHPHPESRTTWRIPEAYLTPYSDWRYPSESLGDLEAALPGMEPWRTSGLDRNRDDDYKKLIVIGVRASYGFAVEKITIPRLLREDLELLGEFGSFFRYRKVRKNSRGEAVPIAPSSGIYYLIPKDQIANKKVYFSCARRCTAHSDFSETIAMDYGFDIGLLDDWLDVDKKVRDLLIKFVVR
jgi:hypothetical protein